MDCVNVVYNAARDGKLRRLKMFLEHREESELAMIVTAKTNGATPLVVACRNGHYDVAEYLIQNCQASVEQPGSVVFDGETIEGAPPLWCAAAAGYLNVVKLLVKHGACVNSTTKTHSTPLRAACFDGHFEIVRLLIENGADIEIPNRHGHTCLMIAAYKRHYRIAKYLLSLGATVNRKSVKGNTALHDCAESGTLEILQLLIAAGAKMDVDSYGMTPLLAASVTGHTHIVEYLIQTDLVSRTERVDALELLGATYVDKKRDMNGAHKLWHRALDDRLYGHGPKLPKPERTTIAAYDNVKEFSDLEALNELLADPDEMRMQSLAIRERILGPAHPDTSYYIRYRGAVYADAGKFNRCIGLWIYALDMQQKMLDPLNPMTQSSLMSFTELFSFMLSDEGRLGSRGRLLPPVTAEDISEIYIKSVQEVLTGYTFLEKMIPSDRDLSNLHKALVITLHLGCLLTGALGDQECPKEVLRSTYALVTSKVRGRNLKTPLHIACSSEAGIVANYSASRFPSAPLVRMLIRVGADVNVRDPDGNTALHLAAKEHPVNARLISDLLDAGSYVDAVNKNGETMQDLLAPFPIHTVVNPLKYRTLATLAARTLAQSTCPNYYATQLPHSLVPLVYAHASRVHS